MAQDAAKLHILQERPLASKVPTPPNVQRIGLSAWQANLESVVEQLGAKTNEATAAAQEVAAQKAFVQQITKKLDVLSRRCKTLEQENTRMCEARVGMIEAEVQTEPDALLLRAQADTIEGPRSDRFRGPRLHVGFRGRDPEARESRSRSDHGAWLCFLFSCAQADTAAVQLSLRDAIADGAATVASLQAQAAQAAADQLAALHVANEARRTLEAQALHR